MEKTYTFLNHAVNNIRIEKLALKKRTTRPATFIQDTTMTPRTMISPPTPHGKTCSQNYFVYYYDFSLY